MGGIFACKMYVMVAHPSLQAVKLSKNVGIFLRRLQQSERQLMLLMRDGTLASVASMSDMHECVVHLTEAIRDGGVFMMTYCQSGFLKRMVRSGGDQDALAELDRRLGLAMEVRKTGQVLPMCACVCGV